MYNDPNAQPPSGQTPYTSSYEQQYTPQPPAQPYPSTQYGAPPPVQQVYVVPPPQQPKGSNKTLWIVLGVIGAIILLVGGGCCAAIYFGVYKIGQTAQTFTTQLQATETADQQTSIASESSPSQQAQNYYLAISVQDYSNAFSYLAPHMTTNGTALTQASFTQQAQALDNTEGKVTDYTATADPSDATKVSVQVTRSSGKTYTVHLIFVQGDYQWVINSFDNL